MFKKFLSYIYKHREALGEILFMIIALILKSNGA